MAFMVPLIASASTASLIGMGIAGVSAYMQIKQGESAKKGLYNQAEYKKLEGRIESVKAKEQGIKALQATNKALASINATASAGGLEPSIGTPVDIGTFYALQPGTADFLTAKDNASLALSSANAQAEELRFAGRMKKQQGYIGALTTIGTSLATAGSIGGPGQPNTGFTPQTMGLG